MRRIRIDKDKKTTEENELTQEEINELNDIELERISKSDLFEKPYNFLIWFCSFTLNATIFIFKISGIYLLWICLHYY